MSEQFTRCMHHEWVTLPLSLLPTAPWILPALQLCHVGRNHQMRVGTLLGPTTGGGVATVFCSNATFCVVVCTWKICLQTVNVQLCFCSSARGAMSDPLRPFVQMAPRPCFLLGTFFVSSSLNWWNAHFEIDASKVIVWTASGLRQCMISL